jgi:DegV family protein with EDD domain
MSTTGILTDSTAQFPTPVFDGRKLVSVISLHIEMNGQRYENGEGLKAADLETSLSNGASPKVIAPSQDEFTALFTSLSAHYSDILTILHSADLSATYENAAKAAEALKGQINILMVDSHSTAIGLGLVVQFAAAAAEEGVPPADIERQIRKLLPKVYSVFCIEGLTYLENSGYLGPAQAAIGEHLQMLPIYVLENGRLVATQKARNYRHLVDILHEFLNEFDHLEHIALLQGVPPFETEARALRERIVEDFPDTAISEHTISATLASIIGPRSLGMFVMQGEEQ